MSSASNLYWRCDPQKHISGKTYEEVTELLQVNQILKYKEFDIVTSLKYIDFCSNKFNTY